ncbi:MAG: tetratricopeptide repeat protein, partial [Gammaproteobacteria bacterium]|nr:tetratricopeptide repeat protein [Gammaproteobacteria bacterium]
DNAGTALRHFWFLIQEALLPGEPILSDAWRITDFWTAAEVASLLGVLVLLTAIVVGLRLRHPAALGGAWLVLWLLPGVGVFPADRYHDSQVLYLAVWGVAFALGFVILQLWRPVGRQLVPGSEGLAFAPIIIVLAVITAFSNVRWWEHRGLFDSEIASDPHYVEGRVELAKEALAGGDAALALNHLRTAVEASKDTTYTGYWPQREARLLLGRASWQVGNYAAAADTLAAALQADPDDPDLLYWLAVTELSQQSHAAAEQHLREARQLRAPFPDADADLGVALAGQQRFVEAYPLLAAAIDAGLGNARRHRALALVYIDGNRLDDAARHLETTLTLRDSAVERARLAWVYWRLGRKVEAEDALRAATDIDDGDAYVDWVRTQLEAAAPTADGAAD